MPDRGFNTGDNRSHRDAVPVVFASLGGLLDVPGAYVFCSNDSFEPTPRNPIKYLLPDDGKRFVDQPQLPWSDLRAGFDRAGWLNLTNRPGTLSVNGTSISFVGVDDPHLGYDDLPADAGDAPPGSHLRIAGAPAAYLPTLAPSSRAQRGQASGGEQGGQK